MEAREGRARDDGFSPRRTKASHDAHIQTAHFSGCAKNGLPTSESRSAITISVLRRFHARCEPMIRPGALRAASSFSTATTPYEESWHQREAALQERLEVYKTPLTRDEEGLRFQIKFVSNRDVSERDDAPEPRASS